MDISIIVCNYNNEKYLKQCIDSLLNQSFKGKYEIIVIDDCSTDSSCQILHDYYNDEAKLRINVLSENVGISVARNSGIDLALGRYICFVDSDDFVESHYLQKLFNSISKDESIGLVQCNFQAVTSEGEFIKIEETPPSLYSVYVKPLYQLFERKITALVWDKIYIKSIIDSNHIRFLNGVKNEDLDFNAKYATQISNVVFIDDSLVSYRQNPDSTTKKPNLKLILDMFTVCQSILDCSKYDSSNDPRYSVSFAIMYLYFAIVIGIKRIMQTEDRVFSKLRMLKKLYDTHKNFCCKNKIELKFKALASDAISFKQKILCIPFVIYPWNINA
ncbi:glycosyltransferase family 2 protein [Shewanella baltica]|uniref:glycosyltransferase family 2 protein n=1 Tax=Shewanella baltica TaxID=62322 RepID=UPI003D071DB7